MSVQFRWSLCGLIICGLVLEISSLARVDNRSFGRPANATTQNQWGRPNQPAPAGHNNWPTYNQTQHYQGQQNPQQNWGTTPRSAAGNPWMRNNQTAGFYPQNPQQNTGWNARPNATQYGPTTPASRYNNSIGWGNSGFGQNSWKPPQQYPGVVNPQQPNYNNSAGWGNSGFGQNSWKPPQQYPGVVNPQQPNYNNSAGWGNSGFGQNSWKPPQQYAGAVNPQQPNYNNSAGWGNSGFGQSTRNQPQQYPGAVNPQNTGWGAGGWGANSTNIATNPPPTNSQGWGSTGFGQGNFNNSPQYPGATGPQNPNPNTGFNANKLAGWNAPSNGPQQNNPAFGAGWSAGQANGGSAPLAPIGGGNNAWSGANAAPGGGGATAWNAGGQAGLSYPNGQPAGSGSYRPPTGNTNPYAGLLN